MAFTDRIRCAAGSIVLLVLFIFIAPTARSQSPQDFLRSFAGQKLILLHLGDQEHAKVKKDKLAEVMGNCNIAVLVKEASWDNGRARFVLENIGTPYVPGKARGRCAVVVDAVKLEISGFSAGETKDSITASLARILQTPEQYLASQGIPFDLPPGPDDEIASRVLPQQNHPKSLLSVDPVYSDKARRAKYQGSVVVSVVVGTDGRVHRSSVKRGIGLGLDDNALQVLSLWRFEPARQLDKPIPVQVSIEIGFHLY